MNHSREKTVMVRAKLSTKGDLDQIAEEHTMSLPAVVDALVRAWYILDDDGRGPRH